MDTDSSSAAPGDETSHLTVRRNTWSFENRWLAKFKQAENMDFDDDHDTWSVASHDSAGSYDIHGLPRRSSLKDLSKMTDSMHSLDHSHTPSSNPGLTREIASSSGDLLNSSTLGTGELKDKSKGGLSNSMILSWLSFKKYAHYPTIGEESESTPTTPVDDNLDSGITLITPASAKPNLSVNTSGKILEAASSMSPSVTPSVTPSPPVNSGLRRNFSLNEVGTAAQENQGMKRNFSFKELNAVAPSMW